MTAHRPLVTNPGNSLSFRRTDVAGALATLVDSDGDGLSDGAEVNTYATNPLNPDSDHDGFNDGVEVAAGSNPNDPAWVQPAVPSLSRWQGLALGALLFAFARHALRRGPRQS